MPKACNLFRPTAAPVDDTKLIQTIGKKAFGLLRIPSPWRPPFFVLPAKIFADWKLSDDWGKDSILDAASAAICDAAKTFDARWTAGIILRSSAVNETLADRGAYDSKPIAADYDAEVVRRVLRRVYEQFNDAIKTDSLAIIVQPLVTGPNLFLGHLSNERRVSKTVNHWMAESTDGSWADRFNSQRASPASSDRPLEAGNVKELLARFKSIGRWCTNLDRGPCHIEWAWSVGELWLLQLDFEDESPDEGVDPRNLIRPADVSPIEPKDVAPLEAVDLSNVPREWGKIAKVKELAKIRDDPYPQLYFIRADSLTDSSSRTKLTETIRVISNGRVVCRTDCNSPKIEKLNLPRTHSVSPEAALLFMEATTESLKKRGATPGEICFILHRFIPAASAAWALAKPDSQIVRVDSLWGIPDGLQFLPHDTFEFDVRRKVVSAETFRYKTSFIQEVDDGSWREIRIARRFGRSTSLAASDVREIALQSHELAIRLNQKTQIMWFCAIPDVLNIGRNLPWFRMTPQEFELVDRKDVGPRRQRFRIENIYDLENAQILAPNRYVLSIHPNVDLIRHDDQFLSQLATVAKKIGAPVELYGSVLGHAYYMLQREGVTVIAVGEPQYYRTRGKQVFAKLVRDQIPDQIREHGETTVLAQIPKQESRTALLVKLFEEAQELRNAEEPSEVEAELADLLEIVRSLAMATGINWEDVEAKADRKRLQRGGFEKGVVLMETGWPTSRDQSAVQQTIVPLRSLGRRIDLDDGIELNFASVLAKGADNTFTTSTGSKYRVSIAGTGLRIVRVKADSSESDQLPLPGISNPRSD
jgi:predicted house-cleaning noncanonical NTP pyrophosphatase (MazG superfamily)